MRSDQTKKNTCLLITGCISPHSDVPYIKINNKNEREKQYIDSLKFYIQNSMFDKIVFCDNSNAKPNSSVIELAKKRGKQFEWLSFLGNVDETVIHGKGYGEGEIIKYAVENSKLIANSDYMVKVTGRIQVVNINTIVNGLSVDRAYFIANSRKNIDTKVYAMSISVYNRYFKNAYLNVYDTKNIFLENLFRDVIHHNRLRFYCFSEYPNIQGVSGSTGETYSVSSIRRALLLIRSNCIRLFFLVIGK